MPVQRGSEWRIPSITNEQFVRFRDLICDYAGIYLREHKRHLLVARLAQRMNSLGLDTFSDYFALVAGDRSGGELRTLINRITTNKTSFFREPYHFEFLRAHLLPGLRAGGRRQVRIWSAGCSSGEEPYSIAMMLQEELGRLPAWDMRVLATDIDTEMLEHARCGRYSMEALAGISPERRRAFFLRGYGDCEGWAQVRPELRNMVEFRRVNLKAPDWGVRERFDAIFCRNVIIYFERALQQQILERLAAHLDPAGRFFSGHSENLSWLRDLFFMVEPTVYRLSDETTRNEQSRGTTHASSGNRRFGPGPAVDDRDPLPGPGH